MESPCSSSWSDSGWIRLPPCTPHNPKEGVQHLPGKSALRNTLAFECLPLALGGLLLRKDRSKPAHSCHKMMLLQTGTPVLQSPRASSQQDIPICSPTRNQLCWSTFTESKESCLAQTGILVSLVVCWGPVSCYQWIEKAILLCTGDESWQHKKGISRPKALLRISEMPTYFWLTCPSTLGRHFRHSLHRSTCEVFTQLHCKCLFTYCWHRSFCTLYQSQTGLTAVMDPFKDVSWCVTSKVFSSLA